MQDMDGAGDLVWPLEMVITYREGELPERISLRRYFMQIVSVDSYILHSVIGLTALTEKRNTELIESKPFIVVKPFIARCFHSFQAI